MAVRYHYPGVPSPACEGAVLPTFQSPPSQCHCIHQRQMGVKKLCKFFKKCQNYISLHQNFHLNQVQYHTVVRVKEVSAHCCPLIVNITDLKKCKVGIDMNLNNLVLDMARTNLVGK